MTTHSQSKFLEVPDYLIYEMDEGKPIYYRGYRDVLLGHKQFEEIMGESTLQTWLKTQITIFLSKLLDDSKYICVVGEQGLLLSKNTHRASDISIFTKENFKLTSHYSKLPPKIVIEIDTKAHIEEDEHWRKQHWDFYMTPVEDGVEIRLVVETFGKGLPAYYGVQQCFRMSGEGNIGWRKEVACTPAFSEYDLGEKEGAPMGRGKPYRRARKRRAREPLTGWP